MLIAYYLIEYRDRFNQISLKNPVVLSIRDTMYTVIEIHFFFFTKGVSRNEDILLLR